jgi:hypothetical protein
MQRIIHVEILETGDETADVLEGMEATGAGLVLIEEFRDAVMLLRLLFLEMDNFYGGFPGIQLNSEVNQDVPSPGRADHYR